MSRRALVTDIHGQDDAYPAALLLREGYEVYGAHRRDSSGNFWRLEALSIRQHERPVLLDVREFTNISHRRDLVLMLPYPDPRVWGSCLRPAVHDLTSPSGRLRHCRVRRGIRSAGEGCQ